MEALNKFKDHINSDLFESEFKIYYHLLKHLKNITNFKLTKKFDQKKYFDSYYFYKDYEAIRDYIVKDIKLIIDEMEKNDNNYIYEGILYSWFYGSGTLYHFEVDIRRTNYKKFINEINYAYFIKLMYQIIFIKYFMYKEKYNMKGDLSKLINMIT